MVQVRRCDIPSRAHTHTHTDTCIRYPSASIANSYISKGRDPFGWTELAHQTASNQYVPVLMISICERFYSMVLWSQVPGHCFMSLSLSRQCSLLCVVCVVCAHWLWHGDHPCSMLAALDPCTMVTAHWRVALAVIGFALQATHADGAHASPPCHTHSHMFPARVARILPAHPHVHMITLSFTNMVTSLSAPARYSARRYLGKQHSCRCRTSCSRTKPQ